ncbi:curli production assembly/transport component CsgE [Draconibacterium orientale]|nr:curli production assembly/transport component CsgE [Draconibacterium orientale]
MAGVVFCTAQNDTTIIKNKQMKQAPEELQKLLNDIQQEETQKVSRDAEIEIDGLLIDETKTKNGRDFYDYFFRDWVPPQNAKNYSIFITEKPYRLTTTMIEIRINETLVFQSFLQPRSDIVEILSQQAVARTALYLQNYEEIVKQLEGADQSGSGIF